MILITRVLVVGNGEYCWTKLRSMYHLLQIADQVKALNSSILAVSNTNNAATFSGCYTVWQRKC